MMRGYTNVKWSYVLVYIYIYVCVCVCVYKGVHRESHLRHTPESDRPQHNRRTICFRVQLKCDGTR